jgi:hypothetical protein
MDHTVGCTDSHLARSAFDAYDIDVSSVDDNAVIKAYDSILSAAAVTARPADHFFRAIRYLNDFVAQPRFDPKWNLNLNELLSCRQ